MAFPTINNGLEYHWHLNGDATDEIGALDLTEVGGISYDADVPAALSDTLSQSADLDGVADYLDSVSNLTFRSICGWFKIDAFIAQSGVRLVDWSGTNFHLTAIDFDPGKVLRLTYPDAANASSQMADVTGVQTGVWYHFAWVGSPTTNTLYINGVAHDATADGFYSPSPQKLILGYTSSVNRFLNCKLCDVRLYSTQLTANDVAEIYAGDYNPGDGLHGHTADMPTITQNVILRPAASQLAQTVDSPTVSKVVPVSPDYCSHGQSSAEPTVAHVHVLTPNACSHTHTAGTPTITQQRILRPVANRHPHSAASPEINGIASNTSLLLQRRRMAL